MKTRYVKFVNENTRLFRNITRYNYFCKQVFYTFRANLPAGTRYGARIVQQLLLSQPRPPHPAKTIQTSQNAWMRF